jgi:hypothetical protein
MFENDFNGMSVRGWHAGNWHADEYEWWKLGMEHNTT